MKVIKLDSFRGDFMTREEMLAKLKAIEPTACPTVMTYDMGLQFEIMDSTGASTNLGNIGDWPLWKFPRLTEEQRKRISEKIEQNKLSAEDFDEPLNNFVQQIVENYENVVLSDVLKEIVNYTESENEKDFFIYCDLKKYWEFEIEFFDTREEITADFFERFQIYSDWEEMDDDTLQSYCDLIDEQGEGLPFYTPHQESEDDESEE